MRRMLVIAVVAGVFATAAGSTAGCARDTAAGAMPAVEAPAGDWPAGVKEAEVYVQVLRRYLSTPGENSFSERTFKTVYVLDRAHPGAGAVGRRTSPAGDPRGKHERSVPIASNTQNHVTTALAGVAHVAFIADRNTATETGEPCAEVRDGGILITLGTVDGDDREVRVGINGFVACDGATWLTYVVHNEPSTGWRVTGTTGSRAIA